VKCQHKKPELSYLSAHADAEERMRKGEQQAYCPWCCKWIWRSHFNSHTDYLEAMDSADSVKGAQ